MDRRRFLQVAGGGALAAAAVVPRIANAVEPATADGDGLQQAIDTAALGDGAVELEATMIVLDAPVFIDHAEDIQLVGAAAGATEIDAWDNEIIIDSAATVTLKNVSINGYSRTASRFGEVGVDAGAGVVVFEDVSFFSDDGSIVSVVGRLVTSITEG